MTSEDKPSLFARLRRFFRPAPIPAPEPEPTEEEAEEAEFWRGRHLRRRHAYFGLALLAGAMLTLLLWERMVVAVRSGQAGVKFSYFSGTNLNRVYGEGVHLMWPWDHMFIYNLRLSTEQRQYQLLTRRGLPVTLGIAVLFRPDQRLLPLLHATIGPEYVDKVVLPQVEAVLRHVVGNYEAEEVYASQRGIIETVTVASHSDLQSYFVVVDNVLLLSVQLPEPIRASIERKMILDQEAQAYDIRLTIEQKEAQRKVVEAQGIKNYQDTIRDGLTQDLLRWQGIQATRDLALSNNAKTVVIGSGKDGLPLILGGGQ